VARDPRRVQGKVDKYRAQAVDSLSKWRVP